jgi:predicted transcriptional regulator
MSQTPVSKTAFTAAREEGKTVKELAVEFGISEANCKKIIKQLNLAKRAIKPGFVLIEEAVREAPVHLENVQATHEVNVFENTTI